MINVLFVCLGNICRSPMAEAIFKHQLKEEGLEKAVFADSAGTAGYHIGRPPHQGTRGQLEQYGISYEGLQARQVQQEDFNHFDYIIVMDEMNKKDLQETFEWYDVLVFRLMDFVEDAKEDNVPDPYFTGNFDYTYELVSEACRDLLAYLKEKHHIKG